MTLTMPRSLLFAAVCGWLLLAAPALHGQAGTFEAAPCPEGSPAAAECGFVTVPADYDDPDGATLRVFVGRVPSTAAEPLPFPTFVLTGGPGERALPTYFQIADRFGFADYVVIEQRSVGESEPPLNCAAYERAAAGVGTTGITPAIAEQLYAALESCGTNFSRRQLDLTTITTNALADDVASVAAAFGYNYINLYGLSYGTRWAQQVVARHPELVRAMVLDSVIPAQVDRTAQTPLSAASALQRVFEACAADPVCGTDYPDLAAVYANLYARLNDRPEQVVLRDAAGEAFVITLSGDFLQSLLFNTLYSPAGIAEIPALLYFMQDEQYAVLGDTLTWQLSQVASGILNYATFFIIECQGEIAHTTPDALAATYAQLPDWRSTLGLAPGISSENVFELCVRWGADTPSPGENDPLQSPVPALLFTGQFDPVSPPAYLEIAAQGLPNATSIVVPGQAHLPTLNEVCVNDIALQFLQNPNVRPDTTCLSALGPAFITRSMLNG
jgi:pimeloyl-ACP methyl ester carboxylesterase